VGAGIPVGPAIAGGGQATSLHDADRRQPVFRGVERRRLPNGRRIGVGR
jgi:hypothetical protein